MLTFCGRRFLYAVPQVVGVTFLTFFVIRLLPANPALAILGPYATPEGIATITRQLGLDDPIWTQYVLYMRDVLQGDLGTSWQTSSPVLDDLTRRLPATLELTTISLLIAALIAVPIGTRIAAGRSRIAQKVASGYGLIAGALPEFWVGLLLIFLLYSTLRVPGIAAPSGQIDFALTEPERITGMFLVDGLLTANWAVVQSAFAHLILPVLTLVIVLVGPILKLTRSTVGDVLRSDFVWYLEASGYPRPWIRQRALRNALPVILTLGATLYAYLLGGAVLVETIFSWGGVGQYAVQAIQNADLMALQGFVLVAGIFTVLVYLVLDIVNAALDPRLAAGRGE